MKLREAEPKALQDVVSQTQANLAAAIAAMAAQWAEIAKGVHAFSVELREGAPRLAECGWTVPMNMAPYQLRDLLLETRTGAIDASLDKFFQGAYLEELMRNIEREQKLNRFFPLLRQCRAAFERKDYLICIPALLVVLEGALAEFNPGLWRARDRNRFFAEKVSSTDVDAISHAVWRSMEVFFASVFKNGDFAGPQPELLNRNWILHGRASADWERVDVVRLYNAIHTLVCMYR